MKKVVTQNRFKSPVLWTSLFGAIVLFLLNLGIIDTGLSDAINNLINVIITALVAFGILNSPTTKSGF